HRILQTLGTFFGSSMPAPAIPTTASRNPATPFSEENIPTAKQFLAEKRPQTDIERITSLAYYLTHYRDTPHFKTLDLTKLNTEAAQPKFSNSTWCANDAVKRGFLVPSTKGHRQLSALGEEFIRALPDREAAKDVLSLARPRRARKRRKTSAPQE